MSLYDWLSNTTSRVHQKGLTGVRESVYMIYTGMWRLLGSRLPLGTNVYDREWDVLVVLDGCRVDTVGQAEWEISGEMEELTSLGSTSREWLAKTFRPKYRDEIASTAYVTANPYSEEIFSEDGGETRSPFNPANWPSVTADQFGRLDEVWRDGWDATLGTVPPDTVTDRAIEVGRETEFDRLIVHYMQPHQPFIGPDARRDGRTWVEENCWRTLRQDRSQRAAVRAAYRENLDVVLSDVSVLLRNADGQAVITADHGNAFGEWGIYGHPNGFLHPSVKRVPWIKTVATDEETYLPSAEDTQHQPASTDVTPEERLQDLGYL